MIKKIILSAMLLPMIFILGCAQISELTKDVTKSSSSKNPEILRSATIESNWEMKQIEIEVEAEEEVEILLKLADQEEVDGYFYLDSGSITEFQITGNSLIYNARAVSESEKVSSARFSFVATREQGTTYILTFSDVGDDTKTKKIIFLEIIYPATGSLFIPVRAD